jgi:cation-transporting ATPase 13A3/4/5
LKESLPENYFQLLERYTKSGFRVLACGTKIIDNDNLPRDEVEKDLIFVGFLIMQNKLKAITTSVIDTIHEARIRTIIITGDNILTAISVGRQCHIVRPD